MKIEVYFTSIPILAPSVYAIEGASIYTAKYKNTKKSLYFYDIGNCYNYFIIYHFIGDDN